MDWKEAELPDQNLLRGAKSIADKADVGTILLDATKEDIEATIGLFSQKGININDSNIQIVKLSIYKNRGGDLTHCYLWMAADKGTCRYKSAFVTDYWYKYMDIKPANLEVGDFV